MTDEQKAALINAGIHLKSLTEDQVDAITARQLDETELKEDLLVEFIELANVLYRDGLPIISDAEYDFTFLSELRLRNPEHPFLESVEPEKTFVGKTVKLPVRMLSTEKAYTKKALETWASRIMKAAKNIGKNFDDLKFSITPKLDGFAAYDDGQRLYTRGDGRRGTDISRVFDRGLTVANNGKRGLGAGEIVVNRKYFDVNLQQHFEHPRNFQASVIKEKELDELAAKAIKDRASVFFPFTLLPNWTGPWKDLMDGLDAITKKVRSSVEYDVDGIIIELIDSELKNEMGATRHHHSWQIAYKENLESVHVKVIDVLPQTSRTGRVNPVAKVEPTRLSGALVQRASAHHYKMVIEKKIGPNAVIQLTRSGEVIPKIEKVIIPATPKLPHNCPSCGTELIWDGDHLFCQNTSGCPAQIINTIEHFFKMLRHVDLFGTASIEKMYANGVRSIGEIYKLDVEDFNKMGFGPKQSENLIEQLNRSRTEKIDDWRFLSAFGVLRLGPGNCEKLLSHYRLVDIFNLNEEQVAKIEGFAKKTATSITVGLKRIKPLFDELYFLGFNLEHTPLVEQSDKSKSPISGKLIVFTGSMIHGSRDIMEKGAKLLGAKVGKSITGKTDMLVTGKNVGASKINDANSKGVKIIEEEDYLSLIKAAK